jgi:hypothetical protein
MMAPRPDAIRLWTLATHVTPPHPPLGLRTWSGEAAALAVLLVASAGDLANVAVVAAQIPSAETLLLSTPVVVLGEVARTSGSWNRLFFGLRKRSVARAPRCGALLARGYVDIGAALDPATGSDVVWGWSRRVS